MKSLKRTLMALVASLALAANSYATPILVGTWNGTSGDAAELVAVDAAIDAYNVANNPDLPEFSELTEFANKNTTPVSLYSLPGDEHTLVWTAPNDYDFYYIMSKYGNPKNGGATFEHALHYVLAGDTLTYNPGGSGPPNGLSHVWVWGGNDNNVPDGGSTVALMGAALAGLSMIRRRK
jgi:hypothetical protein